MKMQKAIIVVALLLITASCGSREVQHIGCNWNVPHDMKARTDGSYFKEGTAEEYSYSIRFTDVPYEAPQYFSPYVTSHLHDILTIKEYVTGEQAAIEGVKVYVIFRKNHLGTVIILNHDYKDFLGICD